MKRTLLRGALAPLLFVALLPGQAMAQAGDALFKSRCALCHSVKPGEKGTLGPNLSGVFGSAAGSGAYAYSAALKGSKIRWDARSLDTWLSGPSKMVPGTKMFTSVANGEDRKKILAYLASLKK